MSTTADPSRQPVVERMDPLMANIIRQKTPQERLRIGSRMYRSARVILAGSIRQQHPDLDNGQLCREIAKRIMLRAGEDVGQ